MDISEEIPRKWMEKYAKPGFQEWGVRQVIIKKAGTIMKKVKAQDLEG